MYIASERGMKVREEERKEEIYRQAKNVENKLKLN